MGCTGSFHFILPSGRAIAQLVARLHGVQEAVGSSPTSPTREKNDDVCFTFMS